MNGLVIITTKASNKHGLGDVKRSIWLAKFFNKDFQFDHLFIINRNKKLEQVLKEEKINYIIAQNVLEEKKIIVNSSCDLLIIDKRDTNAGIYKNVKCTTIGLDNYGLDSNYFDYLINALPYYKNTESNYSGGKFLLFPENIWKYQKPKVLKPIKKVLVTFGGSDPKDLSFIMKEVFELIKNPLEITIILGPLYEGKLKNCYISPHIKLIEFQENIYEIINESHLVITSFGITAYEASIIGTPVFIVNPSAYHEKLTNKVNLASGGVGSLKKINSIKNKLLHFIDHIEFPSLELPNKGNLNLKILIKSILEKKKRRCPICDRNKSFVVLREQQNNLYYCGKDMIFFRNPEYVSSISYTSNYFLDDYKKQYGKTYEEDKENINKLNRNRLKKIQKLIKDKNRKKNLLEVGCALGYFMELAQQTGDFDCEGIEVSSYAANYAKNKLGLNVHHKSFLKMNFAHHYYDVISMWYYIEHNDNILKVIEKIKESLKIGGILALSTPNANGVSARKNIKNYAKKIPADHYYEFSPHGLSKFLEKEGFKLLSISTTGIHPKRWIKQPFRIIDKLLAFIMKKRKVGDTFEGYYQRIK